MLPVDEFARTSELDPDDALRFLADIKDSLEGAIVEPCPDLPFKGVVNIGNSCYIDSLLFAMFSTSGAYDSLMDAPTLDTEDEMDYSMRRYLRFALESSIRLFVNRLRSGELVEPRYVLRFRRALYDLGWFGSGAAALASQQDASELFLFLAETLGAPFLPLQSEIFHGGQPSTDDSRVFTERVIQLSLPNVAPHIGVLFEDMLVDHFFNRTVRRTRDGTPFNPAPLALEPEPAALAVVFSRLGSWIFFGSAQTIHLVVTPPAGSSAAASGVPSPVSPSPKVSKAVEAWQSSRVLPFFTPQSEAGDRSRDVPLHYNRSLMIPFIIKRYSFDYRTGVSSRLGRRVYIPTEIPFGLFVIHNAHLAPSDTTHPGDYTLRLRSVLCHQGSDPRRGHYTAIVSRRPPFDDIAAADALDPATPVGSRPSTPVRETSEVSFATSNGSGANPSNRYALNRSRSMVSSPLRNDDGSPTSSSASASSSSLSRSYTGPTPSVTAQPSGSSPASRAAAANDEPLALADQWLFFDDNRTSERVRVIASKSSLSETFNYISLNAYMVFYELCPNTPDAPSLPQAVYPYIVEPHTRSGKASSGSGSKKCMIL
ncbi:hypothetical protein HK105_200614 [Polyrhizophydium stewartii]|uniref:ubiquitinyl hydrolase 1 n=1 Tax=Polyrhizophydium stewartii TaxID=2732419 RepID=A0ABR4NJJ4_9FUNG